MAGDGLQIWYSAPADHNFVVVDDHTSNVYIVDVNGERQVFVAEPRTDAVGAERRPAAAILPEAGRR